MTSLQSALTHIVEKIMHDTITFDDSQDENHNIFVIPSLETLLIPILRLLISNINIKEGIIVLLNTYEQVDALETIFGTKSTLRFFSAEDFLPDLFSSKVDYLFFLGHCLPRTWQNISRHLLISTTFNINQDWTITRINLLPFNHSQLKYDRDYSLEDRDQLQQSLGRQAAETAYLDPESRILLLLPTALEVESMYELLQNARLPVSLRRLDQELGNGITIAQRDAGLLILLELNPDYTFDTLIKESWVTTWTQGRRLRQGFISQEEANQALVTSGVLHRMASRSLYETFPNKRQPWHCHWYQWLQQGLTSPPMPVEKCWKHLAPSSSLDEIMHTNIDPELREFLLRNNLGLRPALVLWKWYQDKMPLISMIPLIAMIDSYGEQNTDGHIMTTGINYLQYPLQTSNQSHRDDEYLARRRHYHDRYFTEFHGETDLEVLIKIWLSFVSFSDDFDSLLSHIGDWATRYSMNRRKMVEVYTLVRSLFDYFGIEMGSYLFDPRSFLDTAYPYFEQVYVDRLVEPINDGLYRQQFQTYLRPSYLYTLTQDQPVPRYGLVSHESRDQNTRHGQCLLWITLPQQREVNRGNVEVVVV